MGPVEVKVNGLTPPQITANSSASCVKISHRIFGQPTLVIYHTSGQMVKIQIK